MAAPAPLAPVGASVGTTGAAGGAPTPSAEEQFFAPAVLQPVTLAPPNPSPSYSHSPGIAGSGAGTGKWIVLGAMVLFVIAAIVAAVTVFKPAVSAQGETPEVLAPRAPTEGLPTDLSVVVRMQAESTRRIALQTVEQVGGDVGQLANLQPSFKWVAGTEASTDSHSISVAAGPESVTVAVAASNHDICAFGQWLPASETVQYVTMAHQKTCAAMNAPTIGWSNEPGGAASDLPDNLG